MQRLGYAHHDKISWKVVGMLRTMIHSDVPCPPSPLPTTPAETLDLIYNRIELGWPFDRTGFPGHGLVSTFAALVNWHQCDMHGFM